MIHRRRNIDPATSIVVARKTFVGFAENVIRMGDIFMDNSKRAEKIALNIHKLQFPGTFKVDWNRAGLEIIAMITSQLDQAQAEVLEQNEPLVKLRINEAKREGFRLGIGSLEDFKADADRQRTLSFDLGFASAKEKAAGISQSHECSIAQGAEVCNCDIEIAECIRAMSPASTDAPTVTGEVDK